MVCLAASLNCSRPSRREPAEKKTPPVVNTIAKPPELRIAGRVDAQHVISIGVPIRGKLLAVAVVPGENVFEGQILARIETQGLDVDQESRRADAEQARTKLANIEREIQNQKLEASRARADAIRAEAEENRLRRIFDRQQYLYEQQVTPRLVYEKTQREWEQAHAEANTLGDVARTADQRLLDLTRSLADARKALDQTAQSLESTNQQAAAGIVMSPVSGIVTNVNAHAGDDVDPMMRDFIQITTDLNSLEVRIPLDSASAQQTHVGSPALIEIAEYGNEPIDGKVTHIENGEGIVIFTSPTSAIRPGVSALVRLPLN